jgi:hypothetical protein
MDAFTRQTALVATLASGLLVGASACDVFLSEPAAVEATKDAPPEQQTIVQGDVERALPVSFRLDIEDGPRAGDEVLVLLKKGTVVPPAGSEARVSGMLREVGVDDFEALYGRPWEPYAAAFPDDRALVMQADELEVTAPPE